MSIRTNHTVEYLESRVEYQNDALVKYPHFASMIEQDLADTEKDLKEAQNRLYCGTDSDGAKAYVVDGILRVEGKPSGWKFQLTALWSGKQMRVTYDGSTNWKSVITFF